MMKNKENLFNICKNIHVTFANQAIKKISILHIHTHKSKFQVNIKNVTLNFISYLICTDKIIIIIIIILKKREDF